MRAVVLRGGAVTVETVADPVPSAGQILIAPHATGLCGSDIHVRSVLRDLAALDPSAEPTAIVPGHEMAGEVVAVGPDTHTELRPGDLVAAMPFTHGANGPEIIGLSPDRGGGLAEFATIDARRTFRLPDGLDTRSAALAEPLAVSISAYNRAAADGPIVVVGAGPIGLGIVAVAAAAGRGPIIVVEPATTRQAAARALGADVVHEPGRALGELLADCGIHPQPPSPLLDHDPVVTTIFECVGRADVVAAILVEAPPHSRVVLAGACMEPVEIQPLPLTTSEITVVATYAYRRADFRAAIEHLSRVDLSAMITADRPLEQTEAAFDSLAHDPTDIKTLIHPNPSLETS